MRFRYNLRALLAVSGLLNNYKYDQNQFAHLFGPDLHTHLNLSIISTLLQRDTLMPIEDGLYLIHSSGEHIRNYYHVVEYDGQQITTISGASTLPPTEVSRVVFFFCFGFLSVFMDYYVTVAGTTTS